MIETFEFGKTYENEPVTVYRLINSMGAFAEVMDYGCTLRRLVVPAGSGGLQDVCLGYDSVEEYEKNDGYLGAVVGRFANRIAKGRFVLNGREHVLFCNNGENHLHGGKRGFDKVLWMASKTALKF